MSAIAGDQGSVHSNCHEGIALVDWNVTRSREDKGSLNWCHSCITLVYLVNREGCLQTVCGNAEAAEYLT